MPPQKSSKTAITINDVKTLGFCATKDNQFSNGVYLLKFSEIGVGILPISGELDALHFTSKLQDLKTIIHLEIILSAGVHPN